MVACFEAETLSQYYFTAAGLSLIVVFHCASCLALESELYAWGPYAAQPVDPAGGKALTPCPYMAYPLLIMAKCSAVVAVLGFGIGLAQKKVQKITEREMNQIAKKHRLYGWFAVMGPFWMKVMMLTSCAASILFMAMAVFIGQIGTVENPLTLADGAVPAKCYQFPSSNGNKGMIDSNPFCPAGSDEDPTKYPINVVWPNSLSGALNLCKGGPQQYYPIFDACFVMAASAIPISIGVSIRNGIQTPPFLYCPMGEDAPKFLQFIKQLGP
jgi:hypothetical protein